MKNKFTKFFALIISCITIASADSLITEASSSDSNWESLTYSDSLPYCDGVAYTRPKDDYSSVYICNDGRWVNPTTGRYYYKGQPKDIKFNVDGAVEVKRKRYDEWKTEIIYDCENFSGSYYNCKNLRLSANTTRVIFQFVKENYNTKGVPKIYGSYYSARCSASIQLKWGQKSYGVWSPDSVGYYTQIEGQ